jgi:hypothetical protein
MFLIYLEKKHEKRECKDLSDWILQKKSVKSETEKELARLIKSTKGKFFSVSFKQKDGTIKRFNGKDFYKRIEFDNMNSFGFVDPNKKTIFKNQKKGGWQKDIGEIVQFKCGAKTDFVTFDKI